MRKMTQEEYDALPVVDGVRQCPGWTDYCAVASFGERASFGKGCKATSPYWSFVYPPPFETVGPIYPAESCRGYWSQRLGVELVGCYGEIAKRHRHLIPDWLKRTDLTDCERRILESWRVVE